jgi:A/G-specific adenine glycosylase
MNAKQFSNAILHWFDQHGRHDLPWQKNPTSYRVWVSEIMLQQTQVTTVIPYFQKFMRSFPNIKTLALAKLDDVLAHWSGLGYYARARNLHRSAQIIYQKYRSCFPKTCNELAALPGIGLSTAGAILSLSMKIPATILDGNVKRLLARFYALDTPLNNASSLKDLWKLAQTVTPKQRCDAYNQAVMDLGAMICTRSKPKCEICPLQTSCQAFQLGTPTAYPIKISKTPLPTKSIYMLLLKNSANEILLEKRPPVGIWGGLWSLPECPIEEDVLTWVQSRLHMQAKLIEQWSTLHHQFTHFNLIIKPILLSVNPIANKLMDPITQVWYKEGNKLPGGTSTPVMKLLNLRIKNDKTSILPKTRS